MQRLVSQEILDTIQHSNYSINVKSKFMESIFLSLNTLLKSDSYQALTFDLVNTFFSFYNEKILPASKQDIFKDLEFLNEKINKTNIFEVSSNDIVLNKLYYYNEIFKSFINKQKNIIIGEDPTINPETSLIVPSLELIKKEKKFSLNIDEVASDISLYKGEIYCFSLNKDININTNSLIKVKAEVFEHGNINKIYYPKYFYFSPLLLNAPYLEYIKNINNEPNTSNFVGIFNVFNLNKKIVINDRAKLNFSHLNDIVREYFKVEDSSTVTRIVNSIIDNHRRSFKLSRVVDSIHNISLTDCFKKDILSDTFYNMILEIDNNLFYNTFGHTKKDFLEKCVINNEGAFTLDFSNKKYFKTVDFLSNLNYLVSLENQIYLINNVSDSLYENILWDLDISDFKFKDYKKTDPAEGQRGINIDNDVYIRNSSEGQIRLLQNIENSLESFFIEKDLNRELDRSMKTNLNTKLINYENYSVSITIEVV